MGNLIGLLLVVIIALLGSWLIFHCQPKAGPVVAPPKKSQPKYPDDRAGLVPNAVYEVDMTMCPLKGDIGTYLPLVAKDSTVLYVKNYGEDGVACDFAGIIPDFVRVRRRPDPWGGEQYALVSVLVMESNRLKMFKTPDIQDDWPVRRDVMANSPNENAAAEFWKRFGEIMSRPGAPRTLEEFRKSMDSPESGRARGPALGTAPQADGTLLDHPSWRRDPPKSP